MGKGQECCKIDCLRSFLTVFQIIFFITGLIITGIGVYIYLKSYHYIPLLTSVTYSSTLFSLIVAGLLGLTIFCLGCCGIYKNNKVLILIYIFILLLIFLLEAMVGIIAYLYQETVESELNLSLNETFLQQYKVDEETTEAIDYVQKNLKCCGADRVSDWQLSLWLQSNSLTQKVPDSCCKTVLEGCANISDRPSNINVSGCLKKLIFTIREFLWIITATGLGLCIVQVFGIVFGLVLYLKLRNGESEIEEQRFIEN